MLQTKKSKELKKMKPLLLKIEQLENQIKSLTDEELKAQTEMFKKRLANGEKLEKLLPEAFATVREASWRVLGMRQFPVQLMGGIALHYGKVAEMKTGEGKTLVCAAPAYLNALSGQGVYVVTVNDYLAKRDAEEIGKIHQFLGLSVGCVLHDMTQAERKAAYACDITYVTNNELGFDYLRDNMATDKDQEVLRGLNYAIIDEADSVLIDEARTPLIISGQDGKSTKIYEICDILANMMERGAYKKLSTVDLLAGESREESGDYMVDEKEKIILLTETGIRKVEQFFHIKDLSSPENIALQHNVILALKANELMKKDRDYVVQDGEIMIVDEFTGRIMHGRRYSDGLHQAIEAKEHVAVKQESRTLATITFQSFFNKFKRKSGMTGTAMTEKKEFRNIYGMDVVSIPTNRPVMRIDHEDAVYKTKGEKFAAVVHEVERAHATGQPVLVGTTNVETSELLSSMFKQAGIKHQVLNAKHHAMEAEIIANAGKHGQVTIATNMAGRGTDIKLDMEARMSGGLLVIGTERHESRRIDNQLIGRSGRQGDPGESKFFLSLEDNLLRMFGTEKFMELFRQMGVEEGEKIHHSLLTKAIANAQKKIEGNYFGMREQLLKYDRVNNEQREIIYEDRQAILNGTEMETIVLSYMDEWLRLVAEQMDHNRKEWRVETLREKMLPIIPEMPSGLTDEKLKHMKKKTLYQELYAQIKDRYDFLQKALGGKESMEQLMRIILLKTIDNKWMTHLDNMEKLKEGIGLMAYGQTDPVIAYKQEGYRMFFEMLENIKIDTLSTLFHTRIHWENT